MNTKNTDATAPDWTPELVPVAEIIRHQPYQVRAELDPGAVRRYRDAMRAGCEFPPIKLAKINGCYLLVDGWHRLEAYEGSLPIAALVAEMTPAAARWEAAKANLNHGLPLKAAERREVFRAYIRAKRHVGPRGRLKSYREIGAEIGGIAHTSLYRWMKADFPRLFSKMGGAEPVVGSRDDGHRELHSAAIQAVQSSLEHAKAYARLIECPVERGRAIAQAQELLKALQQEPFEQVEF